MFKERKEIEREIEEEYFKPTAPEPDFEELASPTGKIGETPEESENGGLPSEPTPENREDIEKSGKPLGEAFEEAYPEVLSYL